jgi:hypothetical protein|tara:strand:- start:263 stop:445 length:183 start_codon:yes stop_codon:yes gene_type:complete
MEENIMSSQLVYAGQEEEFFWTEDDSLVEEGLAVGFEVESSGKVDLVLFRDIYHEFKEEA